MRGYTRYAYCAVLTAAVALLGFGEARLSPAAEQEAATAQPPAAPPAAGTGMRTISGTVTAVVPEAKTLVVTAPQGKDTLTVGVSVTEHTVIKEGKVKKRLDDVKVGDRVRIKFERVSSGDVAQSIVVTQSKQ
ncbi:MAG: hypothetical protein C3F08_10420 [Candidatus Methylomirabilota bacterium]|nr:MAG: hypothetical protein C3F08_10420 [candidate division NC10 bacterium]